MCITQEKRFLKRGSNWLKITLLSIMLTFVGLLSAQNHSQPITLNLQNVTFKDFVKQIETKTQFTVVYRDVLIDNKKNIVINVSNRPLNEVLKTVLTTKGLQANYKDNTIVITKIESEQQSDKLRKLSGQVIDEKGEPVIGATVMIKGTTNGTITDFDGVFQLSADKYSTLVVSYIGYNTQEIEVNDQQYFNFQFETNAESLDELVVVGYGTQKKINLSGAVESVGGKALMNRSTNNVSSMLQGLVPNLMISIDGGQANQTPTLNIRGATSINQGGSPLILVDGITMHEAEFGRMNSADIESISVLKDASSAAIYGARASFGVILVTTKKGKGEKTQVTFNNTFNARMLGRMPQVVKDPYIQASYKDIMGAPWYDLYTDDELAYAKERSENPSLPSTMINPLRPEYYSYLGSTDWFNEVYNNVGYSHSHNLSLSGATKKASYYLGMEYYQEEGMIKYNTDQYDRYNLRSKVDYQVTDWLKVGNNTSLNYYTYNRPTSLGPWLFKELHNANALEIPKNPDGSWTKAGAKYIGGLIEGGDTDIDDIVATTQLTVDLSLVKNIWSIKGDFTAKFWNSHENSWEGDQTLSFKEGPHLLPQSLGWEDLAQGTHSNSRFLRLSVYTEVNKKINNHQLTALAGFEQESESGQYFYGSRTGLISQSSPTINVASGKMFLSDERYSWATRSGFYRLNYNYGDKYIIETNGRYDGTSRFQKSSRFGFFPSVSAAWSFSKERWFKPIEDWFNLGKIRASYGSLGNQNVGYYEYISNMTFYEVGALVNGNRPIGVGSPNLISNALTWEKVNTINVGIDLNFLRNRLVFSGDIYRRDTKDMLTAGKTLPGVLGATSPRTNAADLQSQGWEVSANWRDQFKLGKSNFNYGARFILSDNRAFITKFDNPGGSLDDYYVGYELGTIWGLTTDGFFVDDADVTNHANQWEVTAYPGNRPLAPGDLKYKDLNEDGFVNKGSWTLDDHGDYSIIGNTSSRYNYGFDLSADWNGFDMRVLLQGVGKKDWYPNVFSFFGIYRAPWSNVYTNNLDHWTPENTNGYFPRLKSYTAEVAGDMSIAQTRYLQDASYLRIKNVTFGYTLPKQLTQKAKIESVRIYFSGENLAEFTKLSKNYDPEGLGLAYPMQRVCSFGLNITL